MTAVESKPTHALHAPAEPGIRRSISPPARLTRATFNLPRLLAELTFLVLAYVAFSLVQGQLGENASSAIAHARDLMRLEAALGLNIEVPVNEWLAGQHLLMYAAGYFYGACLIAPIIVLGWLYVRHPRRYIQLRRSLILTTLPSLPIFWLYAVAPPRFATHGITDVIAVHNILNGATSRDSGNGANLYAAMPSLHVAWACWCAFAIWWCLRGRFPAWSLLAWTYPLLTALDVIATGNHYVLDVVAGGALMVVGVALTLGWRRAEQLWSGRQQPDRQRDHDDPDEQVQHTPGFGSTDDARSRTSAVPQR